MPPRIRRRSTWRRSPSSMPAGRTRRSPSHCRGSCPAPTRIGTVRQPIGLRSSARRPAHIRVYDVLPGHARSDPRGLVDAAIGDWGEMTARLARAIRGFTHPKAQRTMLWDIQHALATRAMLPDIPDPDTAGGGGRGPRSVRSARLAASGRRSEPSASTRTSPSITRWWTTMGGSPASSTSAT